MCLVGLEHGVSSRTSLLLHGDAEGDSSVSNTKLFQTCINNIHVLSPLE